MTFLADLANRLYRFKTPRETFTWKERVEAEQQAFDSLRRHPSYAAFQDLWDAELRSLWGRWLDARDDKEVLALHAEGRALQRLIALTEGAANAKLLGEKAEAEFQRQIDLARLDKERKTEAQVAALEARKRQMQTIAGTGVR